MKTPGAGRLGPRGTAPCSGAPRRDRTRRPESGNPCPWRHLRSGRGCREAHPWRDDSCWRNIGASAAGAGIAANLIQSALSNPAPSMNGVVSVRSPTTPDSSAAAQSFADTRQSTAEGPIRWGSEAHKTLFCRTLLDTFDPYKPAVIDWPELDAETRDRLVTLPIWDIAVQTEGKARLNVASYAAVTADPLLRKAIELNAFEEGRHKHVLSNLVAAYGITLAPEPEYVVRGDPEWAFMVTGYSECIDSFFAFGLFESAKRSGFFPSELVETFEPVIHEEGRHILFFVNWAAWYRRNMPFWRRPFFELKVLAVWLFLIWERIGIARDVGSGVQDNNFTVTGAKGIGTDIDVAELVDICVAENERRMSVYDRRLLRPIVVPAMAKLARRFMRSGPKQKDRA